MPPTNSTVKCLYCSKCKTEYDINTIQTLCSCGAPLLVEYDYKKAGGIFKPSMLPKRIKSMWRFKEVLPVIEDENIVSLGEGGTPILPAAGTGRDLGFNNLFYKDETVNPTGSFKARGLGMAVSRAKELGITRLIIPTAGNAGSALAAYCARAGLKCKIIMPRNSPEAFIIDADYHGAEIEMIDGSIKDCGEMAARRVKEEDWFSIATLKEPYRIEGKKTMGYELAEQFNFNLPDVIIYPTGGGTGLIGMWKAFDEMEKMGWIDNRRPKMIAVQAEGCAPIPKAFDDGKEKADLWPDPKTIAAGLRVPAAVGDFLILKAVRESKGLALTVSDDEIKKNTRELACREGIFSSPEGGASLACLKKLIDINFISPDDRIVVFITGSGYKYLDVLK